MIFCNIYRRKQERFSCSAVMRAIRGRRNDDKGGLKLLHKFRVAAFGKLSRSVTFSLKDLLNEDKHPLTYSVWQDNK